MSEVNYIYFTLLNPANGGTARSAVFNRVEVVAKLVTLAKQN